MSKSKEERKHEVREEYYLEVQAARDDHWLALEAADEKRERRLSRVRAQLRAELEAIDAEEE